MPALQKKRLSDRKLQNARGVFKSYKKATFLPPSDENMESAPTIEADYLIGYSSYQSPPPQKLPHASNFRMQVVAIDFGADVSSGDNDSAKMYCDINSVYREHRIERQLQLPNSDRRASRAGKAIIALDILEELETIDPLPALDRLAIENKRFPHDDLNLLAEWIESDQGRALEAARRGHHHGRVRWSILETLTKNPSEQLLISLAELIEKPDLDPWLLNGVPIVIRSIRLGEFRDRIASALRSRLQHIVNNQELYSDHVSACATGEILLSFGSLALPQDIRLVGDFILGQWSLKAKISAFHSLQSISARYYGAVETDDFFTRNADQLADMGRFLAANSRTSSEDGALFLAWLAAMLGRLGPEAQVAIETGKAFPQFQRRMRYELLQVRKSFESRGPEFWTTDVQQRLQELTQSVQG